MESEAVSLGLLRRSLNSSTTHVDASVDASRDAGSIPAASIPEQFRHLMTETDKKLGLRVVVDQLAT